MPDSSKKAESQVDKFRKAARELETDQSEENFGQMVKKIARALVPAPKDDKPRKKAQ